MEELPLVLWSYRTTPQSSTGENPFRLTYGSDALIPIEILEPSTKRMIVEEVPDEAKLRANLDLLDEVQGLEKSKKRTPSSKQQRNITPR